METPSRFDDLLRRWSDREATVEELAELEAFLRRDARYRRALVRLVRLDVDLHARAARSAAGAAAARKLPGRNLARAAAVLAVGLSVAAVGWPLFRGAEDPAAWRVAAGTIRIAGDPSGRLEPGQRFEVGSEPVRLSLGALGTADLDPATAGVREAVDTIRLERGGGTFAVAAPLRVATPSASAALQGGRLQVRVEEVPASTTLLASGADAEIRYEGLRLPVPAGRILRLGGARTLGRTPGAAELLEAAGFDLATAVDRAAAAMGGVPLEAGLEAEKGRAAFSVESAVGPTLRERTVDAAGGDLIEEEPEDDDRSALAARVRTPLAAAIRTSIATVPGRAVRAACGLQDGAPVARVEVVAAEGTFEVVVDLDRGHVVRIAR